MISKHNLVNCNSHMLYHVQLLDLTKSISIAMDKKNDKEVLKKLPFGENVCKNRHLAILDVYLCHQPYADM